MTVSCAACPPPQHHHHCCDLALPCTHGHLCSTSTEGRAQSGTITLHHIQSTQLHTMQKIINKLNGCPILSCIDVGYRRQHVERLTFVTTGANMELGPETALLVAPLLHTAAAEPVLASLSVRGIGLAPFSSLITVWDTQGV